MVISPLSRLCYSRGETTWWTMPEISILNEVAISRCIGYTETGAIIGYTNMTFSGNNGKRPAATTLCAPIPCLNKKAWESDMSSPVLVLLLLLDSEDCTIAFSPTLSSSSTSSSSSSTWSSMWAVVRESILSRLWRVELCICDSHSLPYSLTHSDRFLPYFW